MARSYCVVLGLLLSATLLGTDSLSDTVEDEDYGEDDSSTFYYSLDDLLGLLASNIVNSSDLIVYLGEEELTAYFPAAQEEGVISYLGQLTPGFSFAKVKSIIGTEPDLSFLDFKLDSVAINGETREISLQTRTVSSITVIPDFLQLSNVVIRIVILVQFDVVSISDRFLLNGISLSGTWSVGHSILDFTISKTGLDFFCKAVPRSGTIEIGKFVQTLGTTLLPEGDLEDSMNNSGLDRLRLDNATVWGQYSSGEGFALAISGSPVLDGWGSLSQSFVMITRYTGTKTRIAVTLGIEVGSFRLSEIIKRVSGFDISDVPRLGSLQVPKTGLVVSTGDLSPNLLPDAMSGLLENIRDIRTGVSIAAELDLVSDQPPAMFIVDIFSDILNFYFVDPKNALTLDHLLSAILPDFSSEDLDLPPGVSGVFKLQVTKFSVIKYPKSLEVELRIDDSLDLIPGYMTILEPTMFIEITFTKPRRSRVVIAGSWSIGSEDVAIIMEPVGDLNQSPQSTVRRRGFIIRGSTPDINVGEIISSFDVDFLPDELSDILQNAGIIGFRIVQPQFTIPVGTPGITIQLSGEPQIGDWSGVTLSAVLSKDQRKSRFVAGFEFKETQFSQLIKTVTGQDVSALKLLDRSLQCAVVISPDYVNDITLGGELLSTIPIVRGVSIAAVFRFPQTCDELFCEFAKGALGEKASMRLKATVSSPRQFSLLAVVNNIELGAGLTLKNCGLEFAVGMETYVGITGSLSLEDPPLSFTGAIRSGLQGLELSMKMNGIWKRAFGFDWLAFGNGILSIAIKPGTPLVGIQIGGEVRIGELDSGKELIAKVYVGIDPTFPRRNYFYGSINQASVGKILEAFGISVSLPRVLSQSGFPDGLETSFALDPIILPGGLVLPHGFTLNGTVNILGFKLIAYIKISIPRAIKIDIRMTPLNLAGGLLKMYASKKDSSTGPLLTADIKFLPIPSINVTAAGYVSLFAGMIEAEIFLQITNTHYIFWIRGRLFLFDALLKVYASYGSLQQASFGVFGSLSTVWMQEISSEVEDILEKASIEAEKEIQDAQNLVNSKQEDFDEAVERLRSKNRELNNAISTLTDAERTLQKKRQEVQNLCRIKSCGKTCIGCTRTEKCCKRVFGRNICTSCPRWDNCCSEVTDPTCAAANVACESLRRTTYAALRVAEKAVDESRMAVDKAEAAVKAAEVVVDGTRSSLNAAIGSLEGVKQTVKAGSTASKFIADLTLGGLIQIRKMEFDALIGLVSEGRVSGIIEVSFLRMPYINQSFELRLKSIRDMALDLADAIIPGISGRKKREVEERMKRALPGYSRRHYLPHLYVYRPGQTTSPKGKLPSTPKQLRYVYERDASRNFKVRSLTYQQPFSRDSHFLASREADEQFERDLEAVRALGEQLKNEAMDNETNHSSEEETLEIPSISDLEMTNSDTREEWCLHFKNLYSFVKSIPEMLEMTFDEWQKSVNSYRESVAQRSKEITSLIDLEERALALSEREMDSVETLLREEERRREGQDLIAGTEDETKEIDEDEVVKAVREHLHWKEVDISEEEKNLLLQNVTAAKKAASAIDQVIEGLQAFNVMARRRLIQENAASGRSTLQSLSQQIKKQTGYSLNDYINLILDKTETLYESELTSESVEIKEAVERIRNNMAQLEGKTLYQAKRVADQISVDVTLVYDKAECL